MAAPLSDWVQRLPLGDGSADRGTAFHDVALMMIVTGSITAQQRTDFYTAAVAQRGAA